MADDPINHPAHYGGDAMTAARRDPEYVYLSPICTAPERTWSDDGASDECTCIDAKHPVVAYRRVGRRVPATGSRGSE